MKLRILKSIRIRILVGTNFTNLSELLKQETNAVSCLNNNHQDIQGA